MTYTNSTGLGKPRDISQQEFLRSPRNPLERSPRNSPRNRSSSPRIGGEKPKRELTDRTLGLTDTIPKETPHNLCDVLRCSLPSRPVFALPPEPKANSLDSSRLESGRLEKNSFDNLLRVIDAQLMGLMQTMSRIKLCHESELSRTRSKSHEPSSSRQPGGHEKPLGSIFEQCVPVREQEQKLRSEAKDKSLLLGRRPPRGVPRIPLSPHLHAQSQARTTPTAEHLSRNKSTFFSDAPLEQELPPTGQSPQPDFDDMALGTSGISIAAGGEDMYAEPIKDIWSEPIKEQLKSQEQPSGTHLDDTDRQLLLLQSPATTPTATTPTATTGRPGRPNRLQALSNARLSEGKSPVRRSDIPTRCKLCGNVFMADAVFCRRCGARRADGLQPSTLSSDAPSEAYNCQRSISFSLSEASYEKTMEDAQESLGMRQIWRGDGDTKFPNASLWEEAPTDEEGTGKKFTPLTIKVAEFETEFRETSLKEAAEMREQEEATRKTARICKFKTIHPHSMKRLIWDMIGGLLIFYDVIVIPLQVLPLPQLTIFTVMQWLTLAFWTFDIPRQFLIGYEVVGGAEMRPRMIAKNYAQSWMVPDVSVVVIDWVCILLLAGGASSSSRSWRVSKSVKAVRLIRLLRLARVAKIPGLLTQVFGSIQSEYNIVKGKTLLMLIVVCVFVHYAACYFYASADFNVFNHPITWLQEYSMEEKDVSLIYMTAVQWAAARSGFSAIEIYPQNVTEHLVTLAVALCWLIVCCCAGSIFTLWLMAIRESNLKRIQDEASVRKFLRQRSVSTELAGKIMQFFRCLSKTQGRIHEQDLDFLRALPGDLRIKLHAQVYLPTLKTHPAFAFWFTQNSLALLSVCHLCIMEQRFMPGDTIFEEGQIARSMMYITHGLARYYLAVDTSLATEGTVEAEDDEPKGIAVPDGTWIAEACLWQRVRHAGRLIAVTTVAHLCVDAVKFCLVIETAHHQQIDCSFLRAYANEVVAHFHEKEDVIVDLWDMPSVNTIVNNVVRRTNASSRSSAMDLWTRMGIGDKMSMKFQMSPSEMDHTVGGSPRLDF